MGFPFQLLCVLPRDAVQQFLLSFEIKFSNYIMHCNCVLCGVSYVDHDSGFCKQYAKNGNKYDISLLVFN